MKIDVVIVGGGPAGLSAALILGRCHRQVLLCDDEQPRNRASHAIHGLLGREGRSQSAFLEEARQELTRYKSVSIRWTRVNDITPADEDFEFNWADGTTGIASKVLLATGIVDELPEIAGIMAADVLCAVDAPDRKVVPDELKVTFASFAADDGGAKKEFRRRHQHGPNIARAGPTSTAQMTIMNGYHRVLNKARHRGSGCQQSGIPAGRADAFPVELVEAEAPEPVEPDVVGPTVVSGAFSDDDAPAEVEFFSRMMLLLTSQHCLAVTP
jgi:NADPH-dependent 2,4-dienoyl-CoA reductase/sulfur reductase-like enzyme